VTDNALTTCSTRTGASNRPLTWRRMPMSQPKPTLRLRRISRLLGQAGEAAELADRADRDPRLEQSAVREVVRRRHLERHLQLSLIVTSRQATEIVLPSTSKANPVTPGRSPTASWPAR
jgi:hypothetical protein